MNLIIVSEILKELLPFHSKVSLPGLGSFIVVENPSEIIENGTLITPPTKTLKFSSATCNNDGWIEKEYSKRKKVNLYEARSDIEKIIKEIRNQLTEKRTVDIPELGKFIFNEDGELVFISCGESTVFSSINIPINVNLVPKGHIIQQVPEMKNIAPPTFDEQLVNHTLEQSIRASVITKSCRDANDVVNTLPELQTTDETEKIPNIKNVKTMNNENVDNKYVGNEQVINNHLKDENVENKGVGSNYNNKDDYFSNEYNIEDVEEKRHFNIYRIAIITLAILIILIVLVTILFIMQDDIRPFLEQILYNSEERAIIKYYGA